MLINKLKTLAAATALTAFAMTTVTAIADVIDDVKAAGVLKVGVKADYRPYGYLDPSGEVVGIEPDLAKDVADKLGVKVEYVPVVSSNRMQFLEQGKIDLMIATMSDKANRRKVVGIPDPNYYTSGTNMLAKKGVVKDWKDLAGKPVCGKQGAFYNKIVSKRYKAKIVAFVGNAEAKQALRDGKCIGWVYDDSSIMADLASGQWDEFEMPLQTEDDTPWGLAVPKDELNGIWGNFMSGMIYNWHRSGRLIELEKKWGIQPTAYLTNMNKKFEAYTPK